MATGREVVFKCNLGHRKSRTVEWRVLVPSEGGCLASDRFVSRFDPHYQFTGLSVDDDG
jgi:hypothetical protein